MKMGEIHFWAFQLYFWFKQYPATLMGDAQGAGCFCLQWASIKLLSELQTTTRQVSLFRVIWNPMQYFFPFPNVTTCPIFLVVCWRPACACRVWSSAFLSSAGPAVSFCCKAKSTCRSRSGCISWTRRNLSRPRKLDIWPLGMFGLILNHPWLAPTHVLLMLHVLPNILK